MKAYHFDVYDIDGTLTFPGYDLWYLATRNLSADKNLFDTYVAEWKSEIESGMDSFQCSLTMMKRGLKLLENSVSAKVISDEVQRITSNLIDDGMISREAIAFLQSRIRSRLGAVFSTTNYQEGAAGFLNALSARGWLRQTELEKICLSGSIIDWNSRAVVHFNMSWNKVIGLMRTLKITEEVLKSRISFVFADDPLGGDQSILEIAPHPYVIRNEKNRHLDLPQGVNLVTWSDVKNF
jgi:hypothetical protein